MISSCDSTWPAQALLQPDRGHHRQDREIRVGAVRDAEAGGLQPSRRSALAVTAHLAGRAPSGCRAAIRARRRSRSASRPASARGTSRAIASRSTLVGQRVDHVERRHQVEARVGETAAARPTPAPPGARPARARTEVRPTSGRYRRHGRIAGACARLCPVPQPQSRMSGRPPRAASATSGSMNRRKPRNQKWSRSARAVASSRRSIVVSSERVNSTLCRARYARGLEIEMRRGVRVFAAIALTAVMGVSACAKKKPGPLPPAPAAAASAEQPTNHAHSAAAAPSRAAARPRRAADRGRDLRQGNARRAERRRSRSPTPTSTSTRSRSATTRSRCCRRTRTG